MLVFLKPYLIFFFSFLSVEPHDHLKRIFNITKLYVFTCALIFLKLFFPYNPTSFLFLPPYLFYWLTLTTSTKQMGRLWQQHTAQAAVQACRQEVMNNQPPASNCFLLIARCSNYNLTTCWVRITQWEPGGWWRHHRFVRFWTHGCLFYVHEPRVPTGSGSQLDS